MILSIILTLSAQALEPKINDQFYQLDYRERISAEVKLPVVGGFEIQGSFETRYRPKKQSQNPSSLEHTVRKPSR